MGVRLSEVAVGDQLPRRAGPVVHPGVLDLGALLVRRQREDEDARAVALGGLHHGVQGAEAEVGAGGDGVAGQR